MWKSYSGIERTNRLLEDTREIPWLASLNEVVELHIRTVAAILMWFVVALLFLNRFLRSVWIWLISIAMMILAVIVYFVPRLRK